MAPPLTSIRPTMGLRDWSMLVLLSVLFGGAFFFVGVSVADLPALVIVTSRVVLAAMALLCIAMMQRARLPTDARSLRAFIAMGLLNSAVPFLLITWAQAQIPSGLAAILNATTPLFTVVIASLALADEKATLTKVLGVVLGICGVWVIFGLPTEHSDSTVAQIAVLTAALSYACAGVYGRRVRAMGLSPVVAAGGQLLAEGGEARRIPLVGDLGDDPVLVARH